MVKHTKPDFALLKLPSLHAIRTFVAAARYQNFTRAAEALCVSQAAVSRQIRDLEEDLGTELFLRAGRSVELTSAGSLLFDTVQLSLGNISRTTERIRGKSGAKKTITLCCSPAFARFWLAPRLRGFITQNTDIDVNIITTHSFFSLDPGLTPDFFITKWKRVHDGYTSQPIFSDVIYPVCSPGYLEENPDANNLNGILNGSLLNLTHHGRSQVDEHVDWNLWFAYQNADIKERPADAIQLLTNDYGTIIDLALDHQGVALGWNYLVAPLIEKGLLMRPVRESMALSDTLHFLSMRDDLTEDECSLRLHAWVLEQVRQMEESVLNR
ncbi:LysR family transcriptional regulator [Pantoea sp. Tr-811]|uniref:LysR family transcriptional regulator n=1 Tax=Pantoea sp. Tr-811 TaxID=2608361 RepID=UPI00141E2077|nr:LysR family transcriptional regulator [Pantoea sp. Tr-811]